MLVDLLRVKFFNLLVRIQLLNNAYVVYLTWIDLNVAVIFLVILVVGRHNITLPIALYHICTENSLMSWGIAIHLQV